MKVMCFGDSWAAGAELKGNEKPFVHWVGQELGLPYDNYGREGSSFGLILHSVITNIARIDKNDIVLVVVPPDTRWYDESEEKGFYSLMNWQRHDYFNFLNNKTLEWFIYHHAVFLYTMQKILQDIGCTYILCHNYGQIDDYKKYQLSIDYSKFLSDKSLTELLSPNPTVWQGYPHAVEQEHRYDQDGPPDDIFSGQYFQGCKQHPNQSGHQKIASMIVEKLKHERSTR